VTKTTKQSVALTQHEVTADLQTALHVICAIMERFQKNVKSEYEFLC